MYFILNFLKKTFKKLISLVIKYVVELDHGNGYWLREEKSYCLNGRTIKALPPHPPELNGCWNFFFFFFFVVLK